MRIVKIGFFILASAVSCGCELLGDRVAERTLVIHQIILDGNSSPTFSVDCSQLPPDAFETVENEDGRSGTTTTVRLRDDNRVRIVLLPATRP